MSSTLRNKNSKASIEKLTSGLPPVHHTADRFQSVNANNKNSIISLYPHLSSKQVTFDHDAKDQLPTGASSSNLSEIVALDQFYQDLLAKERAQFERMLKTRTNITRNRANSKMQNKINLADDKFEKVQELEKKLKMAKDSNNRIKQEQQHTINSQLSTEAKCKVLEQEKEDLREQLERLWGRTEHEKEIAMIVTKEEMEKAQDSEVTQLKD